MSDGGSVSGFKVDLTKYTKVTTSVLSKSGSPTISFRCAPYIESGNLNTSYRVFTTGDNDISSLSGDHYVFCLIAGYSLGTYVKFVFS